MSGRGNKGRMAGASQSGLWAGLFGSRAARVTLAMSCLFASNGVTMVFLPRWLEAARGLSGAEIGAVIALAQLARIGTGPIVAFWADGADDRRTPLRVLAVGGLLAYAAFFFLAHEFLALMALGFVALSLTSLVVPFIEGATLRATATGRLPYGFVRGIGSIAFIVANVAGGVLVAEFGVWAVPAWTLGALTLFSAATWLALPPDPAPHAAQPKQPGEQSAALKSLLRNRRFLILIVTCGLIQSAHAFYYSFSTLAWRGQGLSADAIGLLWSVGVVVEVAFLWTLPFFERRTSPEMLILIGGIGAVVRWIGLGFAPLGFWLWPLQLLHALSFAATHVGGMRLVYREAPERVAGMAQTLYSILTGGVLMGAATLGSGLLYDSIGAHGYWAMAAMALAGTALSVLLFPRRNALQT
jgi:PPP family 3-phenylpropionic acid transporter